MLSLIPDMSGFSWRKFPHDHDCHCVPGIRQLRPNLVHTNGMCFVWMGAWGLIHVRACKYLCVRVRACVCVCVCVCIIYVQVYVFIHV